MAELDELIAKLDIPKWFETNGLTIVKKSGKSWKCACPFCGDKDHFALTIDGPKKGVWICSKCKEKGNAISYYAKMRNCKNGDAVKAIKMHLGIEDDPPVRQKRSSTRSRSAETPVEQRPPDPPDDVKHIYKRFIEALPLLDVHRQEFKKKRGFSDETIDSLMFRSLGKHTAQVVEQMQQVFTKDDLTAAGILVKTKTKAYIVEEQLLQDRVIIPYIDTDGFIYHVRPHKLGFANFPNQVYCPFLLKQLPTDHIILTEGEFKAAALRQWGIPALAIPGTSSFSKKNFDRLINILKRLGIARVTIVFDNEVKDNPSLPNYKAEPDKRFDTQYWAYIIAYKLNYGGIETDIATLPDAWRENGKIDFDAALAQGHTRDEILKVMMSGAPPEDYLDTLPEEALRIIRRKKTRFFNDKLPIKRDFNKYVVTRSKGSGEEWDQTISNFVINIKSSFYTPSGVVRNVELVNEYGERSDSFVLEPGDMAGLNEFKKFCFSKGNYLFEGKTEDLLLIWKFEFLRDTGQIIYMPEKIGHIGNGVWLFGNMAIKKGKEYGPDKDGIIWIDGKGYKPQSMQVGSRGEPVEDAIPSLYEHEVDIKDVAQKIFETIGGYEAYMGLGWVVATIFSKDIFEKYKLMPILFPHGKRESGKSTFMRWLQAFFGAETEGYTIADTTTANFIARVLSYYSSLGVWFDEYRNEAKITQKDGFFRSAYNRQLSGKGTATAFQTKGFSVHATISISGEELPKDNGLFTRCIPLQISTNKRKQSQANWFEWINKHHRRFSGFTRHLILHYDEYLPKMLENIAALKTVLVNLDTSDRTAENWAICAAAFETTVMEDEGFIDWVIKTCQEIKQTGEQEHMLNEFWNDINVLLSEGQINSNYMRVVGSELSLWFRGTYDLWAIHYRKKTGKEPFSHNSIFKYMQDEPYFIEASRIVRMAQGTHRSVIIDINKSTETITEIAQNFLEKNGNTLDL